MNIGGLYVCQLYRELFTTNKNGNTEFIGVELHNGDMFMLLEAVEHLVWSEERYDSYIRCKILTTNGDIGYIHTYQENLVEATIP